MKTFVLVSLHMTINMQDLETWLLSSSCPLTDVLKIACVRRPQKALTLLCVFLYVSVCVCMCVSMREGEKDRDWESKREMQSMSEFVLLGHHTLRPKESTPEADFILHIVEAMQVMCVFVCVCVPGTGCFGVYLHAYICAWPLLFNNPSSSLLLFHQHFVINTYRQCEEDKNRQKRKTISLVSKLLFCIVTSTY